MKIKCLAQALHRWEKADTTTSRMLALWEIRQILVEHQLDLILEVDAALEREEILVEPANYPFFRALGYTFYTDLENARELLTRKEDNDGLPPEFGEVD